MTHAGLAAASSAASARPGFLASGDAGQMVWVDPALEMVVAVTSTVSADSQRRGQAIGLLRAGLVPAARRQAGDEPR
ncbi:hypothetical protein ACFPOE_13275 [Caenimonas terrae]|uniref:Serine hydrolase n=1 Tax=Caenimonas terrae TaxID=696074 RepID=A0ABW0ND03_9BURK